MEDRSEIILAKYSWPKTIVSTLAIVALSVSLGSDMITVFHAGLEEDVAIFSHADFVDKGLPLGFLASLFLIWLAFQNIIVLIFNRGVAVALDGEYLIGRGGNAFRIRASDICNVTIENFPTRRGRRVVVCYDGDRRREIWSTILTCSVGELRDAIARVCERRHSR